jgi:hypothetical protein
MASLGLGGAFLVTKLFQFVVELLERLCGLFQEVSNETLQNADREVVSP